MVAMRSNKKTPGEGAPSPSAIPTHIAVIMDGNGRWAKKRGMPRPFGHEAGARRFKDVVRMCSDRGVKYLTVYAWSTENWSRPKDEVDRIFDTLRAFLKTAGSDMRKNNIRLRVKGDLTPIADDIKAQIRDIHSLADTMTGVEATLMINYGGQSELVHTARLAAIRVLTGELKPEDITEDVIEEGLYTAGMPSPDLLIRTGGELRLSNFLLWQAAYAELYFTDTLWPDFDDRELDRAIDAYSKRQRRFGGV